MLTPDIKKYIHQSVLCWLATTGQDQMPNVSPKEIFNYYGEHQIIVANIASPRTVKNIQSHPKACISFIDVFVQKGYQIKGAAAIIKKGHPDFPAMEEVLLAMTGGKFPFASITSIQVEQVRPIIAPRYLLYPNTTEEEQIASAKKVYLPESQ